VRCAVAGAAGTTNNALLVRTDANARTCAAASAQQPVAPNHADRLRIGPGKISERRKILAELRIDAVFDYSNISEANESWGAS
jgi:hypothetical protein